MDAKLKTLFFLHKAPRYVLLMPPLFANKLIVEFYGKKVHFELHMQQLLFNRAKNEGVCSLCTFSSGFCLSSFTTQKCLQRGALEFQLLFCCLSHNCITRIIFAGMLQTSLVICHGIRKEVFLLGKLSQVPLTPMFHRYFSIVVSQPSECRKRRGTQRNRWTLQIIRGGFICVLGHKLSPVSSSLSLQDCISIQQGVEVNSPALALKQQPAA